MTEGLAHEISIQRWKQALSPAPQNGQYGNRSMDW